MQFLWKYIDDLVGKGLEWYIIAKLLFYASATLVPMALPLAILLSSIMTFGNLGENYELVAMKSSGLSLQKIMLPLIITSIAISIVAFYFSNNILPYANLKMGSLLYDVREQKPALQIKEGIFYNGIDGYSIRVGKKDSDGKTLRNIMIYDHTQRVGNNKVIIAESGKMEISADKLYLILLLNNGRSYEEVADNSNRPKAHPLLRSQFKEEEIQFDLSGFKLTRTDEDLFKSNYQMLNIRQLQNAVDSLEYKNLKRKEEFNQQLSTNFYSRVNSFLSKKTFIDHHSNINNFLNKLPKNERVKILETATSIARSAKTYIESSLNDFNNNHEIITRHKVEWHKKFTLSFACLVLFFIGAPLGAIIRKGGLGMPVVVSVIFFILFHVISITGEKFAKEGILPPYEGMWMAAAVLLPLGIFLTHKATADSSIFDIDIYIKPFRRLFSQKKKHPDSYGKAW